MYKYAEKVFFAVLMAITQLNTPVKGIQSINFFNRPSLNVSPTIDIPSGSSLVVNCSGIRELKWELPTLNRNDVQDRYNTTSNIRDGIRGSRIYENILTINHMIANDTGLYICYYNDSNDLNNEEDSTSVYVFVNDPNQLFIPDKGYGFHLFIPVHHGSTTIIPCLPTFSNINVTFCKLFQDEYELVKLGNDIFFDATSGFTILFSTKYFDGVFTCTAQYGNITQEMQSHLLFFDETITPQPYINSSGIYSPMVNSSFTLNCSVKIELSTIIFMEWDYPNKNENSSRIKERQTSVEAVSDIYNYKTSTRELTVTDAKFSDSGMYRCTVIDHSNKSNTKGIQITIYDSSNAAYINLTTEINTTLPLERQIDESFRIMVSIDIFPYSKNISAFWMKDGNKLSNDEHHEIQLLITRGSLAIKSLRRSDTGIYTLVVSSGEMTSNISVILHVIDEPLIEMIGNQRFYILNRRYVLVCHGRGYPQPVTWWKWKKSNGPDKLNDLEQWIEVENSKDLPNVINESKYMLDGDAIAYLELSATTSGHYSCLSSNTMGKSNKTISFFVTDANNGFDVSTTNENPIEDDEVTLICKASNYHYQDIKWNWKPIFNIPIQNNNSVIPVLSKETVYSRTAVIKFHAIKVQDSGIYECIALKRNISLGVERNSISLNVRDVEKPRFNFTNMNGTKTAVAIATKFEFYCYVEGIPFPEITWYKDGEPYDVSNKSGIELMDKSQKLIINRIIESDRGYYLCSAKNRGGIINTNLTLHILKGDFLKAKKITTTETSIIIVIVVIGILLLSMSIILMKRVYKERKEKKEIEFFSHALFDRGQVEMFNPDMPLADQVELLPYDHRWEFPKERLKLGRTLGQGAFGRVVKAEAIGIEDGETSTTVAVKMLKERADVHQRKALMAELKILIHLGRHLNIVNLLGAVTKNMAKGELMVIVEYCQYGNLRHYLLQKQSSFINQLDPNTGTVDPSICTLPGSPGIENIEKMAAAYESAFASGIINPNYRGQSVHYADLLHRKRSCSNSDHSTSNMTGKTLTTQLSVDSEGSHHSETIQSGSYCKDSNSDVKNQPVTTCDLLCFAFQCARGMEYLASRKLIHRDLAARNVLLAEDNVVKICDFGLAKDCYKYSNYVKKGDGPLPIKWMAVESIRDKVFTSKSDVWSFGVLLWEFFTLGGNPYPGIDIDEEFYKRLKNGFRMEKPEYASINVYEIMQNCWNPEPKDRPDFTSLVESLGELLQASVRKYYVELNAPYLIMNEELLNNNDYLQMGSEGKTDYVNVNVNSLPDNPYDNVGTVRPIDDGPVPKVPMEVVPMIQLEPIGNAWANMKTGNKKTIPAPVPDLLTMSPSCNKSSSPDYLCMLSPKDIDCNKNVKKNNDYQKELVPITLNVSSLIPVKTS